MGFLITMWQDSVREMGKCSFLFFFFYDCIDTVRSGWVNYTGALKGKQGYWGRKDRKEFAAICQKIQCSVSEELEDINPTSWAANWKAVFSDVGSGEIRNVLTKHHPQWKK